jgi:hypothetical protein
MSRFVDSDGDIHKFDRGFNHFVNGKCVNPKSWDVTPIGNDFADVVEECPVVPNEAQITGHVPVFEYGVDTEFTDITKVDTGCKAW